MSFSEIAQELGLSTTWESDIDMWGRRIKLYRDYVDGNHRGDLTTRMRDMLRITGDDTDTEFNINYCNMVVQTIADRLVIGAVQAEKATDWVANLLDWNSIEALQMDVHEAVIRDGDTYVMVGYDDANEIPKLSHELAWDGDVGVIPIYDPSNTLIIAALKVWWSVHETVEDGNRVVKPRQRCNLYLPNMIYRYWYDSWELIDEARWDVGYVPLVHFRHNGRANLARGISEIAPILGLQDSLNRTLVSMTMTSELSAFGIRVAIGFPAPDKVEPGMWVEIVERDANNNPIGVSSDKQVDVRELNATPLVQYIEQADFIINQISTITRTPIARMGSDASSGESLKQREIGLVAKVKKAQIRLGEAWVWAIELAGMVSRAYGKSNIAPDDMGAVMVRWQNAEIRNDNDVVANAKQVRDDVSKREYLRLLAPVFGWDDDAIERIVTEKKQETLDMLGGLNGFGAGGRIGIN